MAFSSIKTFVDGLVLTAAELNTYLSANTDWLKNGIDWMGASDSGDGSRTAQQARTAMLGTDLMTPVNATPVDLPVTRQNLHATGITIPSSGQVLALSAEVERHGLCAPTHSPRRPDHRPTRGRLGKASAERQLRGRSPGTLVALQRTTAE